VKFTICTAEQRTPEWKLARVGRVTGSKAKDFLATVKAGGWTAKRADYRLQLVTERLTGQPQDDVFVTDAMQWGCDQEANAFAAYEAHSGHLVRRTGFLACDDLMVGCSLDGDVDNFTGVIELKCPKSTTHAEYLKARVVPSEHLAQIIHNLYVTGAQWCDFASYDPRFPEPMQLFIARVNRDDKQIAAYELALSLFLSEVQRDVDEMQKLMEPAVA
jgi:predicted phage-related endonuclease